jgi:hypothetical protein
VYCDQSGAVASHAQNPAHPGARDVGRHRRARDTGHGADPIQYLPLSRADERAILLQRSQIDVGEDQAVDPESGIERGQIAEARHEDDGAHQ